jgi:GTP cyclohydrolase-4
VVPTTFIWTPLFRLGKAYSHPSVKPVERVVNAPDVQSQKPEIPIALSKVGLVNVVKEVVFNGSSRPYNVVASINVYTDLPYYQRGMHMSRGGEAITDIVESASTMPIHTFESLCAEIARRTLELIESSSFVEASLKGTMVMKSRSKINGRVVSEPIKVYAKARIERASQKVVHTVGAGVSGMTVCPCAKEMVEHHSAELLKSEGKGLNLDDSLVRRILELVPVASHVQRGFGKIVVSAAQPGVVDIYDLVEMIEDSMSGPTQDVLKRVDEASLVRMAFSKPRFVEDVVRGMAYSFATRYAQKLEKSARLLFSQTNYESIHKHDVKAELRTTMGELLESLSHIN